MDNSHVLIVPIQPLEIHGSIIVCQLKDGVQWGIPMQIYNQYAHHVLEGEYKECESSSPDASASSEATS